MSLQTINLGIVSAIFIGTSPPINTNMLWRNTTNSQFYYYNTSSSSWVQLGGNSLSATEGIVASPDGLQADAGICPSMYNFIDSAANANASIQVAPAIAPLYQKFLNNTAYSLRVYPSNGRSDLFIGNAANAFLPNGLDPYGTLEVVCATNGKLRFF